MKLDEFVQAGQTGISNTAAQSHVVMVSVPSIEHAKLAKSAKKDARVKHITEAHVLLVSTVLAGLPGLHGQHVE